MTKGLTVTKGRMMTMGRNERRDPSSLTCSACGRRFLLDETETPPFCSHRCKMIDLGRWLDEGISVPHEGGNESSEVFEQDHDDHEFD